MEADIAVKDVTKINCVIGIGTTLHKFKMKKVRTYSYLVSNIIYLQQMYGSSIPKHIIKCMEETPIYAVIVWK